MRWTFIGLCGGLVLAGGLGGCAAARVPVLARTDPTAMQIDVAMTMTTDAHGNPALSAETLGDWFGRTAVEFARAGVELRLQSVTYLPAAEAELGRRRGRRALASKTTSATLPIAFVRRLGRGTRGVWTPQDGVVVVSSTATETTLAHEIGHALGLEHQADPTNIMCSCDREGVPTFTAQQRRRLRTAASRSRVGRL